MTVGSLDDEGRGIPAPSVREPAFGSSLADIGGVGPSCGFAKGDFGHCSDASWLPCCDPIVG